MTADESETLEEDDETEDVAPPSITEVLRALDSFALGRNDRAQYYG